MQNAKPAMILLAVMTVTPALFAADQGIWSDVSEAQISSQGERWIVPSRYRTLALDQAALAAVLRSAPLEGSANAGVADVILALPLPDGDYGRFRIEESPIMAPELAARYPELGTFRGQGLDDPTATLRFDLTPAGFHAMILSVSGSIYIDPYSRGDVTHYISYYTRNDVSPAGSKGQRCLVAGEPHEPSPRRKAGGAEGSKTARGDPSLPNGDVLKTYRTVVAATGEYTAFHSAGAPTVAEGMAAIVTAMNRVNGIYERDMAVRMTLVANNHLVVFTNGATDPYTNSSGGAMLGQNQITLDSVIGNANYDIGHVFSTGGGGIGLLGPCRTSSKALGVTGLPSPTGDAFWVNFVAHEMGHQWTANHTFNDFCAGTMRHGPTAYEPGSGTTVMAYAGNCGSQDIQADRDDYFHNISYQEIVNYITTGEGNTCGVATATGNALPVPDAGDSFTIPIDTPFELCGSATDADGDTLTYNWEQFNLGSPGPPDSPAGDAPIFRSFPSKLSPCRTFPQLSDLLSNTQTPGELLPGYARTLTFRMLVRDNAAGGGGADYDQVDIVVSDAGGPFEITSPNTAVVWSTGSTETVTWNVAGTDLSPIDCSQVDLLLSDDGGITYPTTVLAATANDGSADVTVPAVDTTQARLQVRCSDNIFFDVSDTDFTIQVNTSPEVTIFIPIDGESFPEGASIDFGGFAGDAQDGDLTSYLSWESDIEGLLGTGGCVSASLSSLGSHTITARVSDLGGLPGEAETTVTIDPVGISGAVSSEASLYSPDTQPSAFNMKTLEPFHKLATDLRIPKPTPLGGGFRVAAVHSVICNERGPDCNLGKTVYNEQPGTFISSCGCAEDPAGNPECALDGTRYVLQYDMPPGTFTNRACIISDLANPDPLNDCTCTEFTLPGTTTMCSPVFFYLFADGFESGDTSAWSDTAP